MLQKYWILSDSNLNSKGNISEEMNVQRGEILCTGTMKKSMQG